MSVTRRQSLALIAGGAAGLASGDALAQAARGPAPSEPDQRLLRSVENAPWIATPGNPSKPVYVLWAPWCPYCQKVMQDFVAGGHSDVQLRWIGSGPRSADQRLQIAAAFRSGSPDVLRKVLLREPVDAPRVDETYVERLLSVELLFKPLLDLKQARGYPTFIYFDGQRVATRSGYGTPAELAQVKAAAAPTPVAAPDTAYLTAAWKDLGPASGRPHAGKAGYTMYSLPSENAVAFHVVPKGYVWQSPTKRVIGVGSQKWVSVSSGLSIGGKPPMDGYIRIS